MLDINLIRERKEWVKERIATLNDEGAVAHVEAVYALDRQRREALQTVEALKAARNRLSKSYGRFRGHKGLTDAQRVATALEAAAALDEADWERAVQLLENPTDQTTQETPGDVNAAFDRLQASMGALAGRIDALDEQIRTIDADLLAHMQWIPNLPHGSVPVGQSEAENIAHQPVGLMPEFDFPPLAHWDLGPQLGIIDFERGVRLAGTRFYILAGMGARLQRALINWMLDFHLARGRVEVYTPLMVREEVMFGSAQFPKFRENVYGDPDAELYLLPTAEVSITNMHAGEILDEAELPLRYVGHTPCFTHPEGSYDELELMVETAEAMCGALGLPYRRVEMVTGDLGFAASKKYDVEVYAAGCGEWLEVSSCSNCEDFQARRANIKYRPAGGGPARFVHTLNGSGLALPRILIALLENNQQADGTVIVPEVIRPYLGEAVIRREG